MRQQQPRPRQRRRRPSATTPRRSAVMSARRQQQSRPRQQRRRPSATTPRRSASAKMRRQRGRPGRMPTKRPWTSPMTRSAAPPARHGSVSAVWRKGRGRKAFPPYSLVRLRQVAVSLSTMDSSSAVRIRFRCEIVVGSWQPIPRSSGAWISSPTGRRQMYGRPPLSTRRLLCRTSTWCAPRWRSSRTRSW